MWKILLKTLATYLIDIAFNFLYNAIDKNKDGKLSKKELNDFSKYIEKKFKQLRK